MGMFDWIDWSCDCPNCGEEIKSGFQTKDLYYKDDSGYPDYYKKGEILEITDTRFKHMCAICEHCEYFVEYEVIRDDSKKGYNLKLIENKNAN